MADRTGVMTGGSNSFQTTSEDINKIRTNMFTDGPIGAITNTAGVAPMTGVGAVNAQGTPNMTVAVTGGDLHVTATPTSQGSQRFNVTLTTQNATIAANVSGSTKFDWIYVSLSASALANPSADGTSPSAVTVSRSSSSSTDNGTPPSFGYCIAVVTVANAASSITNGNITDKRSQSGVNAIGVASLGLVTPTITTPTIQGQTDGWIGANETWTYVSATTFTCSSALAAVLQIGDKIKLTQTTVKYFYVTGISGTTITVNGGTDYTLANAAITSPYYSHAATPTGFPQWFNYTPTWTGFSAAPSGGSVTFTVNGRACTYLISPNSGTSNATTMTVSLPITAGTGSQVDTPVRVVDNGSPQTVAGLFDLVSGATTATVYKDMAAGGFTASGAKSLQAAITYRI